MERSWWCVHATMSHWCPLHRLPIHQRIQYKLCILILIYGAITGMHQTTSAIWLHYDISYVGPVTSSLCRQPNLRHPRTRMGDRTLSVAGPRAWNALPADIRCAPSLDTWEASQNTSVFCCLRAITTSFILITMFTVVYFVYCYFLYSAGHVCVSTFYIDWLTDWLIIRTWYTVVLTLDGWLYIILVQQWGIRQCGGYHQEQVYTYPDIAV